MDRALGGAAGAADYHVEGAVGLGSGAVEADPAVKSPNRREVLLEAARGLDLARGEEPDRVDGELVGGDGEGGDAGELAVGFDGLVLGGEGVFGGVGPGLHHQPLHLPLEVRHRSL